MMNGIMVQSMTIDYIRGFIKLKSYFFRFYMNIYWDFNKIGGILNNISQDNCAG